MTPIREIGILEWNSINHAYLQREKVWQDYKLTGEDFDKFWTESEAFMKRIEELEEMIGPHVPLQESVDAITKWYRNWIEVMKRRKAAKDKEGTK